MDIIIKSIASGLVVGLILTAVKHGKPVLAGLLLSLPVMTLISFYFAGKMENSSMQDLARTSILALPTWLLFMTAVYISSTRFSIELSLLIGLVVWGVSAGVYLILVK